MRNILLIGVCIAAVILSGPVRAQEEMLPQVSEEMPALESAPPVEALPVAAPEPVEEVAAPAAAVEPQEASGAVAVPPPAEELPAPIELAPPDPLETEEPVDVSLPSAAAETPLGEAAPLEEEPLPVEAAPLEGTPIEGEAPVVESTPLAEEPPLAAEEAPAEGMAELIELTPEEGMPEVTTPEGVREGLISVTLDSVPLQDVVRMFARISGANIVSGTNLTGTVTVSLKDVEWQPALRTILDTAGMTLVMKSPGIFSVVSKSEAAAAPVTLDTIYLRYTTVSNVLPVVQRMLISSNASAASFASANAIIVQETSERLALIKDMVERIDRPRPQVFIEAKFVELNDEAIKNLGINWQSLAGYTISARDMVWSMNETREWETSRGETWNQFDNRRHSDGLNRSYDIDNIAATTMEGPDTFDSVAVGGTVGRMVVDNIEQGQDVGMDISDTFTKTATDARAAILSAADFEVTLSALKQESGVSVVSNPRIIVASGETAKIHVGRKDPNYVTKQEPGPASGTTITKRELSETLPFIETGVRVDVLPTVNTETNITLKIIPELSRILPEGQVGDIPPIVTRTITSEFNLESGRTVAIGGLTSTDDRETVNKVPLLGDIPLIGKYLFLHTKTERSQDEVIIFVTVGLASAETLHTSIGIPSEGRLIHRHMALEATRLDSEASENAR